MNETYIALGANLGDPMRQVQGAITSLATLPGCRVIKQSSWYQSHPIGPGPQANYINGVVAVATELDAEQLLVQLQQIERYYGRVKTVRWGPRQLDLDILLFGTTPYQSEHLQIPHPLLNKRNFVIMPLFEIAPELVLPGGESLAELAFQTSWNGLERFNPHYTPDGAATHD